MKAFSTCVVSPGAPLPIWSAVSAITSGMSPLIRASAIAASNGVNGSVASARMA